jgi:hypothetical protein
MMTEAQFTIPFDEREFVDQGVTFLKNRVLQIDPGAHVGMADFVTLPPDLGQFEERTGRHVIIESGAHKIGLFLHVANEYSSTRESLGEAQSHHHIMAATTEFSGPFLDSTLWFLNLMRGKHLTYEEVQGIGLAFLLCSYDTTERKPKTVTGHNNMVFLLEDKFVPVLNLVKDYAERNNILKPVSFALPVRTADNIMAKALGLPTMKNTHFVRNEKQFRFDI